MRSTLALAAAIVLISAGSGGTTAIAGGEAHCPWDKATILGTRGDDVLIGTSASDVIVGLGGNDTIRGLQGNDTLYGCGGDDKLYGGMGRDNAHGGSGNDLVVDISPSTSPQNLIGGFG